MDSELIMEKNGTNYITTIKNSEQRVSCPPVIFLVLPPSSRYWDGENSPLRPLPHLSHLSNGFPWIPIQFTIGFTA